MPGRFLDTNVLLYLMSPDLEKSSISKRIINNDCFVSVQVLNEIVNVLRKKNRLEWAPIHAFLETVKGLVKIVPVTLETHLVAVNIAERFGFTIYDSMIVASAIQSDCDVMFTEDLQHGQVIDGLLTVVNPFR